MWLVSDVFAKDNNITLGENNSDKKKPTTTLSSK